MVDTIRLSLIRIVEKNKNNVYMIVPVREFGGKKFFLDENGKNTSRDPEGNEYGEPVRILINAVDGTIINSADCY